MMKSKFVLGLVMNLIHVHMIHQDFQRVDRVYLLSGANPLSGGVILYHLPQRPMKVNILLSKWT